MSRVVLDASALLAFLFQEPGADAVAPLLPRAALSAVNYSETLTALIRRGKPLADSAAALARLRLEVVPFDSELAAVTTSLRESTRLLALSLGDRVCLALALARGLPAVTADRSWVQLDIGVRVQCIR